jgi:predicted XRE-type DNA-binding protein
MKKNKQYEDAIQQAKSNLADFMERKKDAIGGSWEDLRLELLTPEERAASALRVAMMIEIANARKERGLTQRKLEELSGVKQPIIARMESGTTNTRIGTLLKVLAPLGKTLYIGDLPQAAGSTERV